jgi:surface antigen
MLTLHVLDGMAIMSMRKLMTVILVTALGAAPLAGCASNGTGSYSDESVGTVLGAVGGAAAGAALGGGKWWAIGAGALVGGVLGNRVGNYLDQKDQQHAVQNANYALNHNADGQTSSWSNPQNKTSGYTTPVKTVQTASGGTCRTYQTGVTANGQNASGTGTACRQPDGTWKVVN